MSNTGPPASAGSAGNSDGSGRVAAAPQPGAPESAGPTTSHPRAASPTPAPGQAGAGTGALDSDGVGGSGPVRGDAGTGHAPTGRKLADMLPWGTARHKVNQVAPLSHQIMLERELGSSMEQSGRTARTGWCDSMASSGAQSQGRAGDGDDAVSERSQAQQYERAASGAGSGAALAAPIPSRRRLSELLQAKTGISRSPEALHPKPLNAEAVLTRLQHLKFDTLFDDDVRSDAGDPEDVQRKRHEVEAMLAAAEGKDGADLDPAQFGLEHYDLPVAQADETTEWEMEEFDDAKSTDSNTSVDSFDDEVDRLGKHYKRFQFQPPSEARAIERMKDRTFHRGSAPIWRTPTSSFVSMGIGTLLYFRLLKVLLVTFLIMSTLALPSLVFNVAGSRIGSDKMDTIGFATTTLGNIGGCQPVSNHTTAATVVANCTSSTEPLRVFGSSVELETAAYIITACDLAYTLVFLTAIFYVWSMINNMEEDFEHKRVSIQRYAVYVTGLPLDATQDEVLHHFNNLYRLDEDMTKVEPRFCRLCPLQQLSVRKKPEFPVKPVADTRNTGDDRYRGTWIAEVSIVHPVHDAVSGYLHLRKRVQRLRAARARVQKYASDCKAIDPRTGETYADAGKHKRALKRLRKLQNKMDSVRLRLQQSNEFSASLEHYCIGAFVVFEHRESKRRCIADYSQSAAWWGLGGCCIPRYLLFRGRHALKVSTAAPPSNIMFENLGTPKTTLVCRRMATCCVTMLLLTISFAIVLIAKQSNSTFSLTPLSECSTDVTASVFDQYLDASTVPKLVRDMTRDGRCTGDTCAPADQRCPSNHVFIWYEGAQAQSLLASRSLYDSSAPCGSPCVPEADSEHERCDVLACVDKVWEQRGYPCDTSSPTYPSGTRLGCFCWQLLEDAVDAKGWWNGGWDLWAQEKDTPCGDFAVSWFLGQLLAFIAALVVAGMNGVLQVVLRRVVKAERHVSQSAEHAAFSHKLLIAQFTNTALIALMLYNRLPNGLNVPLLSQLRILAGTYEGFPSAWYPVVGVAVVITMILNLAVPHAKPLTWSFVKGPCKRCCCKRGVLTQHQMDKLYAGPRWEIDVRYTFVMNTVMVALFFCGGLPILLPLTTVSIAITFMLDKWLLLRKFQRPPAFDSSQARWALQLMPWAVVLHLAISSYMYGNNNLLVSSLVNPTVVASSGSSASALSQAYQDLLDETSQYDKLNIIPLIMRSNVFPLFLLFLIIFIVLLIKHTLAPLLSFLICHNTMSRATKLAMQETGKMERLRGNIPLTREYREILADTSSEFKVFQQIPRPLTVAEDRNGWLITKHGTRYILRKRMRKTDKYRTRQHGRTVKSGHMKTWSSSDSEGDEDMTVNTGKSKPSAASTVNSQQQGADVFYARQFKATWQVIADQHSAHSYYMYGIPKYMDLRAVRDDFIAAHGSSLDAVYVEQPRSGASEDKKEEAGTMADNSRKSSLVGVIRPPELVTSPHTQPPAFIETSPVHSVASDGDPNDPVSMLVSDVLTHASSRAGASTPGGAATPMSWGPSPMARARGMAAGAGHARSTSHGSAPTSGGAASGLPYGYDPRRGPYPRGVSQSARAPGARPGGPAAAPPHMTPAQHAAYMHQYNAWMRQHATWHAQQWASMSARPPAPGAAPRSPVRRRGKKKRVPRGRRAGRLSNSGKRGSLIQYGDSSEPGTPGGQLNTPRSNSLMSSDPHTRASTPGTVTTGDAGTADTAGADARLANPAVASVPSRVQQPSGVDKVAHRTESAAKLRQIGGPSIRVPACPTRHDDLIADFLTTVEEPTGHK